MSWDVFSNSKQHDLAGLPWPHVYIWHLENVMRGRFKDERKKTPPSPRAGRRLIRQKACGRSCRGRRRVPTSGWRPASTLRPPHRPPPASRRPHACSGRWVPKQISAPALRGSRAHSPLRCGREDKPMTCG